MKLIFKKLKKANKFATILYFVSIIAYIVGYVLLTKNLVQLSGIETILRVILIIFFGLWIITWLLVGLVALFTRKYKSYIIMIIFTILFTGAFFFASYYIDSIYKELNSFNKDKVTYTSVLINKKDANFNSSSKIGMIDDPTDIEGYILAKKIIEEKNLSNETTTYNDYYLMLQDLYDGKIDAIFASSNYKVLFKSDERFQNIDDDVKVVYSHSEEMKNKDNISYTNKKLTEPFTILVLGVDSEEDGLNANQAFNGDTMMLITFNPKTLTASIFSMPRDTYVPIACRNNQYAKINSSAASGVSCVTQTIKDLTTIDIDYFVKINFKGVVDLVDALGGITVNVEKPYFDSNNGPAYAGKVCEQDSDRNFGHIVCFAHGNQLLNGEEALAYSRNRHQYIGSDLDRIRHQQDVVEAIGEKVKTITTFDQFKKILNTIQKNTDTNMTTEQILSIYNVGKSIIANSMNGNSSTISMYRTYLETYSLPVWTGAQTTSALGYYQSSLDEIIKIMRINLELEPTVLTKTFEIDYKEEYETKSYGEGLRTNPQEAIMPNLIGSTTEYANNWAKENEITPVYEYVDKSSEQYNPAYGTGIIADQSIQIGTLLNDQKTITFYLNKQETITTPIEKEEENEDTEEVDTHTVIFNSNGGSKVRSQIVADGEYVNKVSDPEKDGYIFRGWYEDTSFTKPFEFQSTKITKDITIFAKWEKDDSTDDEDEDEEEKEDDKKKDDDKEKSE